MIDFKTEYCLKVMLQQQEIQIQESIAKAQESDLRKDATDCGIDFSEFDNVLQPIIDTCTKDAISAGKSWIIQRATAPTPNAVIANYLLRQYVYFFFDIFMYFYYIGYKC